jgi:hypothetical protein
MVYDLGLHNFLPIVRKQAEAFERLKGGQTDIFEELRLADMERCKDSLANDRDAYRGHEALAILSKQCQACATKKDAWHRRGCCFGCEAEPRKNSSNPISF